MLGHTKKELRSPRQDLRGRLRLFGLAALAASVVVVGASCSSAPSSSKPPVPLVGFVTSSAVAANGTIPQATATGTCGSATYGWLSELAHVSITQAKVARHWAAFIPEDNGLAAKLMEASGTIADFSLGGVDVPFDHPFGGDSSFDETLDAPYAKLDQNLGTQSGGNPPDTVHDELMGGLYPHTASNTDLSAGEDWPTFASAVNNAILPGFVPQKGDRVAVQGSWVVDCGHPDFHSELHSVSFMAYGHAEGSSTTVAHAFYNPYEVAQVYNPDPNLSGQVDDPARLTASGTQNILGWLPTEIVRLATGKDQAPIAPVMLEANTTAPTPWLVCAPAGSKGKLQVSYRFSSAPGVNLSVSPNQSTGCATVTVTFTSSYRPMNEGTPQLCPTDWNWLNQNAFSEATPLGTTTSGSTNDIRQLILNAVAQAAPGLLPALEQHLNQPLESVCFPPLTVPDLGMPTSGVASVVTTPDQAMPFAGWVQVSRH